MNTQKLTRTVSALALALLGVQAGHSITLTQVGSKIDISTSFNPTIREASGLGLAKSQTTLWSITDDNCTVFQMKLDGSSSGRYPSQPSQCPNSVSDTDFEGITYAPPPPGITDDHYVYIANENDDSIVPFNYQTLQFEPEVALADMIGYDNLACNGGSTVAWEFANSDPNSGLEGITWDPVNHVFVVVKEKSPGLILMISADLTRIVGCRVLGFSLDYSDISYDPTRQQFWILSDESQAVYLYDWPSGQTVFTYNLGFSNGEGVAYNPSNHRLYIVTDKGPNADSYLYTYNVQ